MPLKRHLEMPGSRREAMPGAIRTGPYDPEERVQVTVVLRQRPSRKRLRSLAQVAARGERLTRAEYQARYGADPKDVDKVKAFARAHKLRASKVNSGARR
ncbi:MAG TPA: protease pro-enzyme activation domain-containing protein [Terriglobia bacterium]|nr:protease pro-enzyme activation domain-containing protein [Terriglobia bacterium]